MTGRTANLTEMNASGQGDKRIDLLSEVLRTVKLKGALFFNGEFSAPWCFESKESASVADALCPLLDDPSPSDTLRLIVFHFLTEGRAYSAAEYRAWMAEAGLAPGEITPTLIHCGVLPGIRPA